jgi:hypothetical protein
MNENYPDRDGCSVIVVLDLAEIVALGESTQHLGTDVSWCGDDEVGMAEEELDEGGAEIETRIQENQIALLEALDEFYNESVFRSACLTEDKAQGRATDEVIEAAKLHSNGAQPLLALVCAESLPKR